MPLSGSCGWAIQSVRVVFSCFRRLFHTRSFSLAPGTGRTSAWERCRMRLLGFQSLQSPNWRLSTPTERVRLNPTLAAYHFSRWRCQWCTWHSLFSFPCSDCSFIARVRFRPNYPLSLKYAVNCYSARKISYVGCYLTWRPWPLAPTPQALRRQFSAFRQRSPSRLWTGVR